MTERWTLIPIPRRGSLRSSSWPRERPISRRSLRPMPAILTSKIRRLTRVWWPRTRLGTWSGATTTAMGYSAPATRWCRPGPEVTASTAAGRQLPDPASRRHRTIVACQASSRPPVDAAQSTGGFAPQIAILGLAPRLRARSCLVVARRRRSSWPLGRRALLVHCSGY